MPSNVPEPAVGLCTHCVHARVVHNPRGSVFILCARSFTDLRFVKYPRLPVLACEGFQENTSQETTPLSSS